MSFIVVWADFGFARFLEDGVMAATLCGSPMYMHLKLKLTLNVDQRQWLERPADGQDRRERPCQDKRDHVKTRETMSRQERPCQDKRDHVKTRQGCFGKTMSRQERPCQDKRDHVKTRETMSRQERPCQDKRDHVKTRETMSRQERPCEDKTGLFRQTIGIHRWFSG
ncbi:unnamed protein product [Cyprideis torosa]|uniref:Uncharacterized protein n=1 Tax=Cyprideis torosa TaxID=163714 RepID=A0A7R8ZJL0_9CRUS|nr:unnamed protein product [Cyprideis torosa]CAG0882526.1 unnamed protein product [Cyprideis torosa]